MTGAPYRILGAGPSGLTAAITLAQAGNDVDVYELRAQCGARFHGDFEGIENWTKDRAFIDEVASWGIDLTGVQVTPFSEVDIIDPSGFVHHARSGRPAVHFVRRGAQENTLDQGLLRAARDLGVRVHFNRTESPDACDIVATGPRQATGYVSAVFFRTQAPDRAAILLNRSVAPGGYAYLVVVNGEGMIAATILERAHDPHAQRALAVEAFEALYPDLAPSYGKSFGGIGQFGLPGSFRSGRGLLVGEAAGLQDALWGFGIRYAMESGRLAAQALLSGERYELALERALLPAARTSLVNRWLYQRGQDALSRALVRAWSIEQALRDDGLPYLRRLYAPDPIRWRLFGRRAQRLLADDGGGDGSRLRLGAQD